MQAAETGADHQHLAVEVALQGLARLDQFGIDGGVVSADMLVGLQEHRDLREIILVIFHEK
ncbi:hypothetical protein MNU22_12545 [Pseudomonas aeruginosa]|uniref:hypothetical protein n=1 Tax=Pseudomonas aeruginosa TaxID=287 RepID=UPI001FF98EA4|nr:hypothetical protein [Pseudomonas aeruginosa]MCT2375250.1 hypothetical protein [Pseudomonas aeruginosa]